MVGKAVGIGDLHRHFAIARVAPPGDLAEGNFPGGDRWQLMGLICLSLWFEPALWFKPLWFKLLWFDRIGRTMYWPKLLASWIPKFWATLCLSLPPWRSKNSSTVTLHFYE